MTVDSLFYRGTEIEVQVANLGRGGQLFGTALGWRFEPDSVKFYDNGVSASFAPWVVYDTVAADTVWRGQIVHPGKLIVTGVGPSNTDTDTLVIGVSERPWTAATVLLDTTAYNDGQLILPDGPDMVFGRFHSVPFGLDGALTAQNFFTFSDFNGLRVDDTGPNGGYYWIESVGDVLMPRGYSLNDWIDPPGQGPYGPSLLTTTDWLISQGDSVAMTNFRAGIIRHERGPSAASHLGRHNFAAADFASCGHLTRALERLVGDSAGLTDFFVDAVTNASQAIAFASSHDYVFGHMGPDTALVADWITIPHARTWLDTLVNDGDSIDSPNCDISGL